jgi:hypothetical protein
MIGSRIMHGAESLVAWEELPHGYESSIWEQDEKIYNVDGDGRLVCQLSFLVIFVIDIHKTVFC